MTEDFQQEEAMDFLYDEISEQYEENRIYEKIVNFYIENPDILLPAISNLDISKELQTCGFYTSAFLHSIIAIEVCIKNCFFKPIIFSLSTDNRASELLFNLTFRLKSIPQIDKNYFEILKDVSKIDLKNVQVDEKTVFNQEINAIQKIRNEVVHQGKEVSLQDSARSYHLAKLIIEEILPKLLDFHQCKIDENNHVKMR